MDQKVRSCGQSKRTPANSQPVKKGFKSLLLLESRVLKNSKVITKVVGVALIFLTLTTTAVVVAQSCHDDSAAIVPVASASVHGSHGDHHHPPAPTQGLASAAFLPEVCAGIFFLVLILGSKFVLRIFNRTYTEKKHAFISGLIAYCRRAAFNLTLSLPQLGICRI